MDVFQIKNLTFTYPTDEKPTLKGISLSISSGEFVAVCGKTGSGKTTMLRHLKPTLTPCGSREGEIYFLDAQLNELSAQRQAAEIGYVLQSPDNQIVTDKVWHELAFGLESLGYDTSTIRLRVAETASYFGMEEWFNKSVFELSGGQKQLLNLASIMAMQPSVLILDEPTSQLDPIAATEFLHTVHRINRDLGVTVIISEHRLEELLPLADRLVVMDGGEITENAAPRRACANLKKTGHDMFISMPTPVRVYARAVNCIGECPLTVREGREWLAQNTPKIKDTPVTDNDVLPDKEKAIEVTNAWFRYDRNAPDVLKGMSLHVNRGEILSIVGGNGAGKTTALAVMAGLLKPYRGRVKLFGKSLDNKSRRVVGVLPQDTKTLFLKDSVRSDLQAVAQSRDALSETAEMLGITHLLDRHPYDLSCGEQQLAALAKVLMTMPGVLLLDEPTKGVDGFFKERLSQILKGLVKADMSIVIVSHDLEFCARMSDRSVLLFNGINVTENPPKLFFRGNSFYTTAASRMSRGLIPNAVLPEDITRALESECYNEGD